jgi:hypothetical protein
MKIKEIIYLSLGWGLGIISTIVTKIHIQNYTIYKILICYVQFDLYNDVLIYKIFFLCFGFSDWSRH